MSAPSANKKNLSLGQIKKSVVNAAPLMKRNTTKKDSKKILATRWSAFPATLKFLVITGLAKVVDRAEKRITPQKLFIVRFAEIPSSGLTEIQNIVLNALGKSILKTRCVSIIGLKKNRTLNLRKTPDQTRIKSKDMPEAPRSIST